MALGPGGSPGTWWPGWNGEFSHRYCPAELLLWFVYLLAEVEDRDCGFLLWVRSNCTFHTDEVGLQQSLVLLSSPVEFDCQP